MDSEANSITGESVNPWVAQTGEVPENIPYGPTCRLLEENEILRSALTPEICEALGLDGQAEIMHHCAGPIKLGTDLQHIAAQLREISRISNKYGLRECIEGHNDALGDCYTWRDLMEQCDILAAATA